MDAAGIGVTRDLDEPVVVKPVGQCPAADPKLVGRWLADVDIAYDAVWMDYIGDCDCTESLE